MIKACPPISIRTRIRIRRYIGAPACQTLHWLFPVPSSFFNQPPPNISSLSFRHKSMSQKNSLITDLASIPTISDLYRASELQPSPPDAPTPPPSSILNAKISLVRASITTLAVTSIVNAANQTLLGGGGVVSAPAHHQRPFRILPPIKRMNLMVSYSRTVQFTRPPAPRFSLNVAL